MARMSTGTETMQKRSFDSPDEVRPAGKGEGRFVSLEGVTFGRVALQPGWKWSESVKPIAKTDSCPALHHGIVLRGRLHVVMDDGSEEEYGPGDVYYMPPGHDAWVVGDETYEGVDFAADEKWAKPS
jgi:hypothetical protein